MNVYSLTREFLIEHFKPCDDGFSFSKEDTLRLYEKIEYILKSVSKEKAREAIREAFSDFFADCAKVVVVFKDEDIAVKLLKYEKPHNEDEIINDIALFLQTAQESECASSYDANAMIIYQKCIDKIKTFFQDRNSLINFKEITKKAIRKTFCLQEKDLVLFVNDKIVVRFFDAIKDNAERRFEGLPQKEIEALVKKLFPDEGELLENLQDIIEKLLKKELNFATISGDIFEKMHINFIHSYITELFNKRFAQQEVVIKALASYVLRVYFFYLHELIAESILESAELNNKNIINFFIHYKGHTFVENGQKYLSPTIKDSSDRIWRASTIINFIIQYKNSKNIIQKFSKELKTYENEKKQTLKKLIEAQKNIKKLESKLKKAFVTMNELIKKLEESRTNLKKRRSYALEKNITEGLAEFEEYAKEIASANKEFFEYMENLKVKFKATKKQIRDYEKRIEFLDLKIESKKRNYQKFQQDFTKTQEQYDDLVIALSRTLTQKRKKVS